MFAFFLPFAIGAKSLKIFFITMRFTSLRQHGFLLINNGQSEQHFKQQIARCSSCLFAPACCSPNVVLWITKWTGTQNADSMHWSLRKMSKTS